jgi:hypothetical protein
MEMAEDPKRDETREFPEEMKAAQPFRVEPHDFGFRPELDLNKMNQLVDELDAVETAKKLGW